MSKRKGYCRDSAYKRIVRRDGERCRTCGSVPLRWESVALGRTADGWAYTAIVAAVLLHLDHVRPLFDGGQSVDENFQLLCASCHQIKTARECAATDRRRAA